MRKCVLTATALVGGAVLSAAPAGAQQLVSSKVETPPVVDAAIDDVWSQAEVFAFKTVVAEYKAEDAHYLDKWWDAYEGNEIPVRMRSVYTDDNIYFLIRWKDSEDSMDRQSWYYDEKLGKWTQKPKYIPDENGREPAYEDKFTFFWNLTISDFQEKGCEALCHDTRMHTNRDGDIADIWHWKRDRGGPVGEVDDKWLNNDENGRHGDPGSSTYSGNSQELETAQGKMKAPLHWIPGRMNYHWILQSEIDAGFARKIVDVDADGNLVDEDGTVIRKEMVGYDSAWTIPSLTMIKPGTGSRADLKEAHKWKDGVWTLEIVRARDTGDPEHDVQFTRTGTPYEFSVGIMDNAAIAHATPGGYDGNVFEMMLAE